MLGLSSLQKFVKTVSNRSGLTWVANSIKGLLSGRTVSHTDVDSSLRQQEEQTSTPKRTSLLSRRKSRRANTKPKVKEQKTRVRYDKAPNDPAWKQGKDSLTSEVVERLSGFKVSDDEEKAAIKERNKQHKVQAEARAEADLQPKYKAPKPLKHYVPGLPGYGHYHAKQNLDLGVPHHQIDSSDADQIHYPSMEEMDAATYEQLKAGLMQRGPNRLGYRQRVSESTQFSASVYWTKGKAYQDFRKGWKVLCGQDHQKQLDSWDNTCKVLQEYLTGYPHPVTPADIAKHKEHIRRRKNRLSQVSVEQHPIVKRYIDSVEHIINTASEQLSDQRKEVVNEFNGNSQAFQEACKDFGIKPRRDFKMSSLQLLQSRLNEELGKQENNDDNSLRHACVNTVLKFLDERHKHMSKVTHNAHPETQASPSINFPTSNLPLPPVLPHHPNQTDTTDSYYFSFNGDEPVGTNFDNVHYLVLSNAAREWQHGSLPPEFPQISVQTAQVTHDMATDGAAYSVTTSAAEPEALAARQQLLLKTPLCQITPDGQDRPDIQLAAFERDMFSRWDTVCRHTAGIATPPDFNRKEYVGVIKSKKTGIGLVIKRTWPAGTAFSGHHSISLFVP